ncbi:hypothetical protein GKZ90_0014720 [Flavobacterium sp. MC2016-06]|jgi:hypothetical protein|uniref:hypothetical protein n=1 Tax=Flavobacterium sp. MC2016-06 TaxID=2676308 RepID=UPI0012BA8CD5|nr:hypothetical protein [Flavobacterium sp. MC2016-06]MBU3859273.1 hypothetical protein [Flavobacterium sp. MC2016-06]
MKPKFSFIALTLILFILISCNNLNKEKELELKEKELLLKERELNLKEKQSPKKSISTNDAIRLAEKQFRKYLPKILKSHEAILDIQESYTGDFTGDGIEDVAIYFSLASNQGGNAIVGQGLTLYQNDGFVVNVIAGYEPDYLFEFDKINNGKIYVEKLEYTENDGRCCPSIKTEHTLTISGSNAY